MIERRELVGRVQTLAKHLQEKNIDILVLFDADNIRYYADFRMNKATESILVIGNDGIVHYIIPPLDYQRALESCWIGNLITFPEDTPNYLNPLKELYQQKKIRRIGIEASAASYHKVHFLKEVFSAEHIPIDQILVTMRAQKTAAELELIRESARIIDTTMAACVGYMQEGMSEAEVSGYARYIMEKEGAEGAAFDPFLMSGVNACLPQRFSSEKKLQKGELFIFDMGAKYQGYCSDLTRTISFGGITSKQEEIYEVAFAAQQKALKAVRPGIPASEIDKIARDYIADCGYGDYFPHITGHGLGISVHEMPILNAETELLLKPNMVVTVEPGIYVRGTGAARVEDMVLLTDEGYEVLTKSRYDYIYQ